VLDPPPAVPPLLTPAVVATLPPVVVPPVLTPAVVVPPVLTPAVLPPAPLAPVGSPLSASLQPKLSAAQSPNVAIIGRRNGPLRKVERNNGVDGARLDGNMKGSCFGRATGLRTKPDHKVAAARYFVRRIPLASGEKPAPASRGAHAEMIAAVRAHVGTANGKLSARSRSRRSLSADAKGTRASFGRFGLGPVLALGGLGALACGCAGKAQGRADTRERPAPHEVGGETATAGTSTTTDSGSGAGAAAGADGSGGGGSVSVTPFASCHQNTDCMVTNRACCAACGDLRLDDVVALNRAEFGGYRDAICASGSETCSTCSSFWNPYLLPHCIDGQCAVLDVYQSPYIDCETSADCRLRSNTCCPCEFDSPLISVSAAQEARLTAELCDAEAACDDCPPISVADLNAGCDDGRCVLLSFPR